MIIKINQSKLAEALNKLRHIAKPTKTNLIFQNVHVSTASNDITLTAINETSKAVIIVDADIDTPYQGEFLVNCAKFADIINTYTGEIEIEYDSDVQLVFICKNKAVSQLPTVKADNFPLTMYKLNTSQVEFSLPTETLKTGFTKAAGFVSSYSLLSGVNIDLNNNSICFKGCDGNRAIVITQEIQNENILNITLPQNAINNLIPLLDISDTLDISIADGVCGFFFGKASYYTRVLEGEYPNLSGVFPKETKISFSIEKTLIKPVLERIKISEVPEDKSRINFDVKGITLDVSNPQKKVQDTLIVDKNGEDIKFTINREFLNQVISTITSDKIEFKLNEPTKPILFEDKDTRIIVMPIG